MRVTRPNKNAQSIQHPLASEFITRSPFLHPGLRSSGPSVDGLWLSRGVGPNCAMLKKRIMVASLAMLMAIAGVWRCWSPLAEVQGNFTFRDAAAIRWVVRCHTLQPILQIYQEADGKVRVTTGKQTGPLQGGGKMYYLIRSTSGWKIIEDGFWWSRCPTNSAERTFACAPVTHFVDVRLSTHTLYHIIAPSCWLAINPDHSDNYFKSRSGRPQTDWLRSFGRPSSRSGSRMA